MHIIEIFQLIGILLFIIAGVYATYKFNKQAFSGEKH